MTEKIKKHVGFGDLVRYIIGLPIVLLLMFFIFTPLQHFTEWYSDQTEWYEYRGAGVYPLKPFFATGEVLKFQSDIHYKKDVEMRWEDTLWCQNEDGLRKYQTQYWPKEIEKKEFKKAGDITKGDEGAYWEYTAEATRPQARQCRLCGVAIGYTPLGYKKPWSYCTEWFEVNKNI